MSLKPEVIPLTLTISTVAETRDYFPSLQVLVQAQLFYYDI